MTDTLIDVTNLTKLFGLRPALRGISFRVPRGVTVALLGPNGSGKTTLLRILAALSRPTAGEVTIGGWSLPGEAAAVRAQLGVVGHLPLLYDDLSAAENLRFYARLYGMDAPDARIRAVLDRVGLAKRAGDWARTFSRGMQQRLAIARAMLHDPAVLLLDEPYTGLDAAGATMLDGLITEWREAGRTVIASLHDIGRAALICNHTVILRQGQIVADQAMDTVQDLPALFMQLTA